jgi:hypothetical protein
MVLQNKRMSILNINMKMFPDVLFLKNAGMRGKSRLFEVEKDFRYVGDYGTITVKAGFITDGASIPSWLWCILGPFGKYFEAALIHDYIYVHGKELNLTKKDADYIFLEGLEYLGVNFITRYSMFNAVRLFGRGSF